jgi:hypothetical protein
MTSPAPSVTVMIRPAADEAITRDLGRPLGQAVTLYVANRMDRLRKRGEELAVAAPARPPRRDGVMASSPQPRRRWLLKGAGAAFSTWGQITNNCTSYLAQSPTKVRLSRELEGIKLKTHRIWTWGGEVRKS